MSYNKIITSKTWLDWNKTIAIHCNVFPNLVSRKQPFNCLPQACVVRRLLLQVLNHWKSPLWDVSSYWKLTHRFQCFLFEMVLAWALLEVLKRKIYSASRGIYNWINIIYITCIHVHSVAIGQDTSAPTTKLKFHAKARRHLVGAAGGDRDQHLLQCLKGIHPRKRSCFQDIEINDVYLSLPIFHNDVYLCFIDLFPVYLFVSLFTIDQWCKLEIRHFLRLGMELNFQMKNRNYLSISYNLYCSLLSEVVTWHVCATTGWCLVTLLVIAPPNQASSIQMALAPIRVLSILGANSWWSSQPQTIKGRSPWSLGLTAVKVEVFGVAALKSQLVATQGKHASKWTRNIMMQYRSYTPTRSESPIETLLHRNIIL